MGLDGDSAVIRNKKVIMIKSKFLISCVLAFASVFVSEAEPKYVFYFIGDGMGFNHVLNAQLYQTDVIGSKDTLTMLRMPVMSAARTHSYSSRVTDSAAAGTALATGRKTRNGMLGMGPDTVAVTSIAEVLFKRGWGIGLVTTDGIDDATPGAFYAHVKNRGERMQIGKDLADSGFQFAAGAGLARARDKEGKKTELLDYFAKHGVKVSYGTEGLSETADRMLVLSSDSPDAWTIGYTIDSIQGGMKLRDMTYAGIRQLMSVTPDRFFMMVECGGIDHAGHSNDGGTIVREVLDFDESLKLAYDFYMKHPEETLIVVTADHETGGMSAGTKATGYSMRTSRVGAQKISKEAFADSVKSFVSGSREFIWKDMTDFMREKLGWGTAFKPSEQQNAELEEMFEQMMTGRSLADEKTLYATFDGFTARVFEILNAAAGFGFSSHSHTGAMVPVFAIGEGAERFSPLSDNTEIPRRILSIALGISVEDVPL